MSDIYQKIKYIRYVDVYGNENIDTLYMHYNSVLMFMVLKQKVMVLY